ncbi:MAG: hypothetical protein ACE5KM_15010, partial [Planctomycetaceae bacterium]
AAQLGGDTEEQAIKSTLAEISRSFVTLERALGGGKLKRAWVIGPRQETQPLCVALQERLGCDVLPLEPLSQLGIRLDDPDPDANLARFAGPLGMLLAASEQTVPQLDFLKPRKSIVGMDAGKKRMLVRAAVAAAVVLVGLISAWAYNSSLAGEIGDKKVRLAKIEAEVAKGKPALDAAKAINEWTRRSGHTLNQFWETNAALPGTDRIYLKETQFTGGRGRMSRMRVRARGFAKHRSDVESLEQRLKEMGYAVNPTTGKETSKDPDYPYEFKLDILVPDPKKRAKKKKKKPVTG